MPRPVTIALCTRNGMPWLPAQLDSLLAQGHEDWSLWIGDDGSTDGTLDCLAAFAAAHPGRLARIVEGPRRGSAANFLSLLCHPDFPPHPVALCDQDDVWLPEKLGRAETALRGLGETPAIWAARYLFCDETLERRRPSPLWPRPPSFQNALVQNILSGHTLTLNAAALRLVRRAGVQDVLHHDWWIYQLMTGAGATVLQETEPMLLYRQHGRNTVGAQRGLRARLSRLGRLFDGTYRDWSRHHLAALGGAEWLLSAPAGAVLDRWASAEGRLARLRLFRRQGLHRQSRAETLALMTAILAGRA